MISRNDEYILATALSNERIASEVAARAVAVDDDVTAAEDALAVIDDSAQEQRELREYLTVALASRRYGEEIAEQLELIVECLEYRAADDTANNAALAAAQARIQPLSAAAREYLIVAMANRAAANRVADQIDAAGVAAADQSAAV